MHTKWVNPNKLLQWGAQIPLKGVMVVGIDVYHDIKSKAVGKLSVAGVVSSLNATYSKWYSSVAEQTPGQELIDTLKVRLVEGCKGTYFSTN